jgi:hypothetical protein
VSPQELEQQIPECLRSLERSKMASVLDDGKPAIGESFRELLGTVPEIGHVMLSCRH